MGGGAFIIHNEGWVGVKYETITEYPSDLVTFLPKISRLNPYNRRKLGELILGIIIPFLLFSNRRIRLSRSGSLFGAGLVLVGIAWNRFNISWFAIKPLDNLSYTPHWMEVAILVGVAASLALIYTVLTHYFPVFDETVKISQSQ